MLAPAMARAQQIAADRPGIGADPEVVPQFMLQGEIGSDAREGRLGVLPGFELDRDDTSWGGKLALLEDGGFKASLKLSYDNQRHTGIEVPANFSFSRWFNLGTDMIWSRASQTYAGEFNLTPTPRLTITPTLYYDTRPRGAVFAAWIPKAHDNLQLDIGYDQRRVRIGISAALNLVTWLRKR